MRPDRISPLGAWQYALVLVALALAWPALVNRGPIFFPDTSTYIRGADALAGKLTGHRTEWTRADDPTLVPPPAATPAKAQTPGTRAAAAAVRKPVLSGRSVYYGLVMYAGVLLGGLSWTVLFQALTAGGAVVGLARHFVDPGRRPAFAATVTGAIAVLCLTPLPYFVSLLMPDLFTGLALIAVAALLFGWSRERVVGRLGWLALVLAAMLFHASNVLVVGALTVLALAAAFLQRLRPAPSRPPVLAIAVAILLALLGEFAFNRGVEHAVGAPPIRPPFLTARLTADGPGTEYLRTHCPQSGFLLCRYRDRLPLHSDSFLWTASAPTGVFSAIPYAERYVLSREEGRFVLAVVADAPLAVFASSAAAIGQQLVAVGMSEFNYNGEERSNFVGSLPARVTASMAATRAWRETLPIQPAAALVWPLALAAFMTVGLLLFRDRSLRRYAGYGAVLVTGWLLNNIVCGAMSTPHDRYQTRAIWVLVLIATLVVAAAAARRDRPTAA